MEQSRDGIFRHVAALIPPAQEADCTLVGVDGQDASGKTTFANDLAAYCYQILHRPVIRISIDDFHYPKNIRYRRGRKSADGYWLDSFDYHRFHDDVLKPLGASGSRSYKKRSHDLLTDLVLDNEPSSAAEPGSIVIVDGVFLHRQELSGAWHMSVFLDVPANICALRMMARDGIDWDSTSRYYDGQKIYLESCHPKQKATVVVDNSNPQRPILLGSDRPLANLDISYPHQ